jgi:hypothetical protein
VHKPGFVYLLHFDRPIGNPDNPRAMAQHYIGHARRLSSRLAHHRAGTGARLTAAVVLAGIDFTVVRVWRNDRNFERKLKNQKNARRYCATCKASHVQG